MAKKRRDNKRDPSAGQRLVKFGKAALAVGAGAALLNKTRFSKELLDDYIPAIGKSTENVCFKVNFCYFMLMFFVIYHNFLFA